MPDPTPGVPRAHRFVSTMLIPEVVFSGPDIDFVLEMVVDILQHTAGPGLPAFTAWLREKYGPEPPFSDEDVARHVSRCAAKFEQALGAIQS